MTTPTTSTTSTKSKAARRDLTPQEILKIVGGFAEKSDRLDAQMARNEALFAEFVKESRISDEKLRATMAANAELARIADEKLSATMAANAELARMADEKLSATMAVNAELARLADEKLSATMAANAELARMADEKARIGDEKLSARMDELSRIEAATGLRVEATARVVEATSLKVEETTRVVSEIGRRMGALASSLGEVAEEYFFNSLNADPTLGDVVFDSVTPNLSFSRKEVHNEFDIVMVNGKSVALIEVKHKAHVNDLKQVAAQVERYRYWRPEHKDYDIYCGLAAFSVPAAVAKAAHAQGLFVLRRKGGVFQADAQGMRAQ